VVLVDASVWIFAERSKVPVASLLPRGERVATCPMIMQEVLRGTSGAAHYDLTRRMLFATEVLDEATPFARFEEAAKLFLACRNDGITPRTSVDCLVAATAIAYGIPLLHDDRDFENIKRFLPLQTLRPTRSSS
jgi:predicted nucleic acid-binding protein